MKTGKEKWAKSKSEADGYQGPFLVSRFLIFTIVNSSSERCHKHILKKQHLSQ